MNNKLEEQLAKAIEKAMGVAEKTGEFVIEQAPELLREFYAWHIAEHCLIMVLSATAIIMPWIFKKVIPTCEDELDKMNFFGKDVHMGFAIPGYIVGIGMAIFAAIEFCNHAMLLVKILVAPKLYLIEYFLK